MFEVEEKLKKKYELRRENLRVIAKKLAKPDSDEKGFTALGDIIDRQKSQVSQILGPNPSRPIGEILAENLEKLLLEAKLIPYMGWLDQDHIKDQTEKHEIKKNVQFLPVLDLKLSSAQDSIILKKEIEMVVRNEDVVALDLDLSRAFYVVMEDDSMGPNVPKGGAVAIDTRKKEIEHGKRYLLKIEQKWVVRRIHEEPGAMLKISCDNMALKHEIKDIEISKDRFNEFVEVIGKVVLLVIRAD